MNFKRITKGICCFALSLLFAFPAVVSTASAAGGQETKIIWLPASCSEPEYYNSELDWVVCEDGDIYNAATGTRVYGYTMARTLADNLILVLSSNSEGEDRYGFIDKTGKTVLPPEFTDVIQFTEDLACVKREVAEYEWKYGFIDINGNTVIPFEYENAEPFSEGLAYVSKYDSKDGLQNGFIDKTGKFVLTLNSGGHAYGFRGGISIIQKSVTENRRYYHLYGVIDKTGTVIVPMEYDDAFYASTGVIWLKSDGKWGAVDSSGQFVVPLTYDGIQWCLDGLAAVKKDNKYGCCDLNGKILVPLEYDYIYELAEDMFAVEQSGKIGFFNAAGNLVTALEYDPPPAGYRVRFSEGLAAVEKDGKEGYIDKEGRVAIPFDYGDAFSFSEGLAFVKKEGKYGAVDKSGNLVIPFEYDSASSFSGGVAKVKLNKRYGFIDQQGNTVVPLEYNDVGLLTEEKFDDEGNEIELPPVLGWVKQGNRYGVFRIKTDPTSAAPLSGSCGDHVTWSLDESTGVLTISGQGPMYDYELGYDSITYQDTSNAPWWDFRHQIRTVIVEDGVTHIGKAAFCGSYTDPDGWYNTSSVVLADSVVSIGESAFANGFLESLRMGTGLETIGDSAFWANESLCSVVLPEGLKSVESCAFVWTGMKEITIPRSVTNIGSGAFGLNASCSGGPVVAAGFTIIGYKNSSAEAYYNDLLKEYNEDKARFGSWDFMEYNYPPDGTINFVCLDADEYPYAIFSAGEKGVDRHFTFNEKEKFEDLVLSKPSSEYNPRLSHMLSIMARAAYDSDLTRDNLKELGFAVDRNGPDYIDALDEIIPSPYAIAKKMLPDGSEIVMITIRGSWGNLWEQSWLNNADIGLAALNGLGKHEGFENNANEIFRALDELMGGVKNADATYVITGHSQAAATGNLLAVKLYDNGVSPSKVYDCNFACPNVACLLNSNDWNPDGVHNNIFNINNVEDPISFLPSNLVKAFVPRLNPLSTWGKFGQSRWFYPDDQNHNIAGHDMLYYVDEMNKERPFSEYATYSQLSSDYVLRVLGIHCPVDVTIYDSNGMPIAGVINNEPCNYDTDHDRVIVMVDGDEKWICLPTDHEYDIRISATDVGEMLFEVIDFGIANGELLSGKAFEAVPLTPGKEFSGVIGGESDVSEVRLFVIDQQGKIIDEIQGSKLEVSSPAESVQPSVPKETGKEDNHPASGNNPGSVDKHHTTPYLTIVFALLGVIVVAIAIIVFSRTRRKKDKE